MEQLILILICAVVIIVAIMSGLPFLLGIINAIWIESGWKEALGVGIFILSVIAFPIVKEYAPQYQSIVGLPIVVMIGGFLVYRFMTKFKED